MTTIGKGFTLLELMITLGMAAIIATFAMPVYREQVRRGHRMDAVTVLYRAGQYVESARTVRAMTRRLSYPLASIKRPRWARRFTCCVCSASRSRTAGIRLKRIRSTMRMRAEFIRWTRRASGQIDR
jgi:prepilin-type N-terminal cleavage/methylation domain-containing protein